MWVAFSLAPVHSHQSCQRKEATKHDKLTDRASHSIRGPPNLCSRAWSERRSAATESRRHLLRGSAAVDIFVVVVICCHPARLELAGGSSYGDTMRKGEQDGHIVASCETLCSPSRMLMVPCRRRPARWTSSCDTVRRTSTHAIQREPRPCTSLARWAEQKSSSCCSLRSASWVTASLRLILPRLRVEPDHVIFAG